jgi:C4-dicarboxylate-binding protein DctP
MKKSFVFAALGLTMMATSSLAFAETTIRVTLQLPEKHSLGQNWLAFKKIVEEKSGGELKVQLFPSAQLYKDKQVPEAVGSGAIEAGSVFLGRYAGAVPEVEFINLPFLLDSEAKLRAATAPNSGIRKIVDDKILAETGGKVLWWQAYGRNVYLSHDVGLSNPEDFKGKKVRTYGKILGWTVESLGGAPTLMSGSKQFLAYQQGAVDVGMTGVSAVKSRKLYEVMNHMTMSYDFAIEFVAVMNNEFFNGLTKDQQAIVMDAAKVVEKDLRDKIFAEEAEIVEFARDKMTVVDLTPEQRAQYKAATKSVADRFVQEVGPSAKAIVDAANAL